jgi:hypothetical protein
LLVVGSCIGVYVVLAFAFNWLIEPTVAKSREAAASLPPSTTVVPDAQFAASARARAELPFSSPIRQAIKPHASPAVAAGAPDQAEKAPAVETKKPPRKQAARTPARSERRESGNSFDFAFGHFNSNHRPFF